MSHESRAQVILHIADERDPRLVSRIMTKEEGLAVLTLCQAVVKSTDPAVTLDFPQWFPTGALATFKAPMILGARIITW